MKRIALAVVIALVLALAGSYLYETHHARVIRYRQDLIEEKNFLQSAEQACVVVTEMYSQAWGWAIRDDRSVDKAIAEAKTTLHVHGFGEVKSLILKKIQSLKPGDERFRASYDKLVSMYGVFAQIEDQAESPTGSLMTFNQKMKEMQSEFTRTSNEFDVLLPAE